MYMILSPAGNANRGLATTGDRYPYPGKQAVKKWYRAGLGAAEESRPDKSPDPTPGNANRESCVVYNG